MTRKHFLSLAGALLAAPLAAAKTSAKDITAWLAAPFPEGRPNCYCQGGMVRVGAGVRDDVSVMIRCESIMSRKSVERMERTVRQWVLDEMRAPARCDGYLRYKP